MIVFDRSKLVRVLRRRCAQSLGSGLVLAALWACTPAAQLSSPAPAPTAPDAIVPIDIEVTHLGPGSWQVAYAWPADAERLRFVRDRWTFRTAAWQVVTPGVRLVIEDGAEFAEREDGEPLRALTVRFASDPTKREREYPLNPRFTDGSEAIFTGLLEVVPLVDGNALPAEPRLRLVPAPGEHVVVHGRVQRGNVSLRAAPAAGTFAYFGRIAPVAAEGVTAIIDPGLPPHMWTMYRDALPELFAHFTEAFGRPLERTPLVLVGYDPGATGQRDMSGDVLPSLIRFQFTGGAWAESADETAREALYLLAHEAAHLWNGDLFQSAQNADEPWMHEGGAEAFAWLALYRLGRVDDAGLRAPLEGALNRCLLASAGLPMRRAMRQSRVPYDCGMWINLMVAAELAGRGGAAAFWRALFDAAAENDGRYDAALYYATLERLAGNSQLSKLLQAWLDGSLHSSDLLLADIGRLGFRLEDAAAPASVATPLVRMLVTAAMGADCGGRYSATSMPDGIRLHPVPGCETLPERALLVTELAGVPLSNPADAWAAALHACASGRVSVGTADDEAFALPCPTLPRTYLAVTSLPRGL